MLTLNVCEILTFVLENLGQGRAVEKRHLRHSVMNIYLYKSRTLVIFTSSHRISDIIYYIFPEKLFDFENIGQGHDAQHSQWRHSMINILLTI